MIGTWAAPFSSRVFVISILSEIASKLPDPVDGLQKRFYRRRQARTLAAGSLTVARPADNPDRGDSEFEVKKLRAGAVPGAGRVNPAG